MPSILKVIIHGARNLDAGGASTQRQPDAFVELSYGRLTRRSDVVKASRDPLWTRAAGTFKLELGDDVELATSPLVLRVVDRDLTRETVLGLVQISLEPLLSVAPHLAVPSVDAWLREQKLDGGGGGGGGSGGGDGGGGDGGGGGGGGGGGEAAILRSRHLGLVTAVVVKHGVRPHAFLEIDPRRSVKLCALVLARTAHVPGRKKHSPTSLSFQVSDVLFEPAATTADLEFLNGRSVTFEAAWSARFSRFVALRVKRAGL